MPRTSKVILQRIGILERANADPWNEQRNVLIDFMDYEDAEQFYEAPITQEWWMKNGKEYRTPRQCMVDNMDYALSKATERKGRSAAINIHRYSAWLWLDGNDELANSILEYSSCGLPQLRQVCDYLDIADMYPWAWETD
jgi:hypothetical protein